MMLCYANDAWDAKPFTVFELERKTDKRVSACWLVGCAAFGCDAQQTPSETCKVVKCSLVLFKFNVETVEPKGLPSEAVGVLGEPRTQCARIQCAAYIVASMKPVVPPRDMMDLMAEEILSRDASSPTDHSGWLSGPASPLPQSTPQTAVMCIAEQRQGFSGVPRSTTKFAHTR